MLGLTLMMGLALMRQVAGAAAPGFRPGPGVAPAPRAEKDSTSLGAARGGQPRVLGGAGITYQKRLPGDLEIDGWNTAEIIARGDTTTHVLNGHVVNQGKNIRLVDPEKPGAPRSITRGRIALEIEAAEIFFRKVEIKKLDEKAGETKK